MSKQTICVLGGTGFVGSHLANHLTRQGYIVRIPSRRRERHRDVLVMPTVDVIEGSVHDTAFLREIFDGCDAVVNLVAILNESRRGDFQRTHVDLPRSIVKACLDKGVKRLLHMSAINADPQRGTSQYLRTKGEGENIAHQGSENGLEVTSFRPSIIFGPGDHFFNMFATLLRRSPIFFPVVCAEAKFAPVYVDDITQAFITAHQDRSTIGQRYDLCGPRTYTFQQIVEFTDKLIGTKRTILGLGDGPSRIMAAIMGRMPGKPFTRDNYLSTKMDSVCAEPSPLLGENPTPIEAVVPLYVGGRSQKASYDAHRYHARREEA